MLASAGLRVLEELGDPDWAPVEGVAACADVDAFDDDGEACAVVWPAELATGVAGAWLPVSLGPDGVLGSDGALGNVGGLGRGRPPEGVGSDGDGSVGAGTFTVTLGTVTSVPGTVSDGVLTGGIESAPASDGKVASERTHSAATASVRPVRPWMTSCVSSVGLPPREGTRSPDRVSGRRRTRDRTRRL